MIVVQSNTEDSCTFICLFDQVILRLAFEQKSIREAVPHIFRRPVLSVEPHDSLLKAGTFLAIGPQIYVDGLVVLDGSSPVGRIGGKGILKHILESKGEWQYAKVADMMDRSVYGIEAGSSLSYALDIFGETRFAFVPVTINYRIAASLTIRDVQRYVISSAGTTGLDRPVKELSSPIVTFESDASVGNALAAMVQNNIRNIVIRTEKDGSGANNMQIINDRKILEFLLSHDGRQMVSEKSLKGLYEIKVAELEMHVPQQVEPDMPARKAAELMSDINTPCLLVNATEHPHHPDSIITPWDIVMREFRDKDQRR
jgi:CBS domain-containing protein